MLFVAQRLTKYPLLLEPLLKTAGDDAHERELLQKALCGVKVSIVLYIKKIQLSRQSYTFMCGIRIII